MFFKYISMYKISYKNNLYLILKDGFNLICVIISKYISYMVFVV